MLKKIKEQLQSRLKKDRKNENQQVKHAQHIAGIIVMVFFCIGFGLFVVNKNKPEVVQTITPHEFDGVLDKKFNESTDEALIETQEKKLTSLSHDLTSVAKKHEAQLQLNHQQANEEKDKIYAVIKRLTQKIERLEHENSESKNTIATLIHERTSPPTRAEQEVMLADKAQARFYQQSALRHAHIPKPIQKKRIKTNRNYVWAGTSVEGTLTTGILADAGLNGAKNLSSGVIRLTDNGIMPNRKQSFLKDCFVTYSSYGDLSSEAAVVHLDRLSCASDRMTFERVVYGSVFDTDAMQDLRGTVILKSKPLLEYSAVAGLLAGLGDGLKNAGTIQSYNTNGTVATFNPRSIGQQAAGGALSNPANKVADYIMKIADIYHPIVVVKPTRTVTVVFLQGFWAEDDEKPRDVELQERNEPKRLPYYSATQSSSSQEKEVLDKLLKQNPELNQPIFKGAP